MQTLLNRKINSFITGISSFSRDFEREEVRYNDIPTFGKVGDNRGDGAECLGVDYSRFDAEKFSDIDFDLCVDV